jgi:hypothetical protein
MQSARTRRPTRAAMAVLCLVTAGGCRRSTPAAGAGDGRVPAGAATAPRPAAAPSNPSQPSRQNTAGRAAKGAPGDVAAVFYNYSDNLIPLVCFKGKQRIPMGEDEEEKCLVHLPQEIEVWDSEGSRVRAKGREKVLCELVSSQTASIPVQEERIARFAAIALGAERAPRWLLPEPGPRLNDSLRRQILQRVRRSVPRNEPGTPEIDGVSCLGIGPGGKKWCFVTASQAEENQIAFGGVFLLREEGAQRVPLILQSESETLEFAAAVDLYNDGNFMVVVETHPAEGDGVAIGVIEGDTFRVLGNWGCGG